jgi:hypothetical protein
MIFSPSGDQRGVIAMARSRVIWRHVAEEEVGGVDLLVARPLPMKTSFEVKKPRRPSPFVFATAMSAAARSAFRALVPDTTSDATSRRRSRARCRPVTCRGPAGENRMSYA